MFKKIEIILNNIILPVRCDDNNLKTLDKIMGFSVHLHLFYN